MTENALQEAQPSIQNIVSTLFQHDEKIATELGRLPGEVKKVKSLIDKIHALDLFKPYGNYLTEQKGK